jgi:hypothetical protein
MPLDLGAVGFWNIGWIPKPSKVGLRVDSGSRMLARIHGRSLELTSGFCTGFRALSSFVAIKLLLFTCHMTAKPHQHQIKSNVLLNMILEPDTHDQKANVTSLTLYLSNTRVFFF